MKHLTYQELLIFLQSLSEEQKQMDVTIYNSVQDEYYAVSDITWNEEDDVVISNCPYLVFEE